MNKSRSSLQTAISISWHCNFQGMCFLLFLFAIQNGWDNIPPGSVKRNYPFLSAFPWTLLLPDLRARINNPPHSLISALSSHRARKSEDLVQYRINEVCIMFITSQRHGQYNNQQILDPFPPLLHDGEVVGIIQLPSKGMLASCSGQGSGMASELLLCLLRLGYFTPVRNTGQVRH